MIAYILQNSNSFSKHKAMFVSLLNINITLFKSKSKNIFKLNIKHNLIITIKNISSKI